MTFDDTMMPKAAGSTSPRTSSAGHQLACVARLLRASVGQCAIEPMAALCLRAVCDAGPWTAGRFHLTRGGQVTTVRYAASGDDLADDDVTTNAKADTISIDIGTGATAHLELRREGAVDGDPACDVVVTLAVDRLARTIERSLLVEARDKAEADRVRRWALLKRSEDALREQYARLYTAINNMSHGLAMYDENGCIVLSNDLYATMYGLAANDVRPGTSLRAIAERRRAKGFEIADAVEAGAFETAGGLALKVESRTWRLSDGRRMLVSVQPLWNGGWVTTHEDTTERERFEERISHLAHHDALTDLANRVLFRERLDRALADARLGGSGLAVLWFDLDRFKIINDTLGHIMGDLVLKAVGRRLAHCVRETDVVGRLGGDEFAILHVPARSVAEVDALAQRVRDVIAAPFVIEGQRILIEASIGICMAPEDTNDADQLLVNADTALYRAKAEGRATHRFFKPGMDAAIQRRRQLEADLRRALDDDAFELHYQPIIDLNSGRIVSCEALMRWRHPELGPISPADFIPVAEEAGLMVRLGRWLLARACMDAAAWPAEAAVAVNISPSHVMSPQLVADVVAALELSGLPSWRLEVEITEAVLMQHTDKALYTLRELRTRGVRLAMDDFGTGYSSLAYLGRFPFSKIKIDRSFITGLPDDKNSHAIVKAITGLSDGLGVVTTAEGVETESQLSAVLALGCTQVQGFLFSGPVPNDILVGVLNHHSFDGAAQTLRIGRAGDESSRGRAA